MLVVQPIGSEGQMKPAAASAPSPPDCRVEEVWGRVLVTRKRQGRGSFATRHQGGMGEAFSVLHQADLLFPLWGLVCHPSSAPVPSASLQLLP